jgi:hypothetical protein
MKPTADPTRPPAWEVLEAALTQRRAVRARYNGHERVLCPHALGWKHGRAKVLAYQSAGSTSIGTLPSDTRQRWRSMFVDEIEHATITDDNWHTADNYTTNTNSIDEVVLAIPPGRP